MKISSPVIVESKSTVTISSLIELDNQHAYTAWVEVSSKYKNFLCTDATAFASAFVLPAMKSKHAVTIHGSVSTMWLHSLQKIMNRVVGWNVGFSEVTVTASQNKPDSIVQKKNVGLFFSGGVDSFSSYLKYKKSKKEQVTHLIFVHGFDIALDNQSLFAEACSRIEQIAKREEIECIVLKTNIRTITDAMLPWDMSHGGCLALIALLLRNGFSKIIIPGSGAAFDEEPWGSCSFIDPLWSTEALSIVHDLDEKTRQQKIQNLIAPSPLALENLRVCWRNLSYNCGHCDKCLSTMIDLRIAGVLEKSKTFPISLDLELVKKLRSDPYTLQGHLEQSLQVLEKTNKDPQLAAALRESLQRSYNPSVVWRFVQAVRLVDKHQNSGRLFAFLLQMQKIGMFVKKRISAKAENQL